MPDFTFEMEAGLKDGKVVCGIDEVGRGPLAGPVIAAAAIVTPDNCPLDLRRRINDSKKMSFAKREDVATRLIATIPYAIAMSSVQEIDTLNILQASLLAMRRAFARLPAQPDAALIDGNQRPAIETADLHLIVKGDTKSLSIAAASIIAKSHRDKIMRDLALIHTGYGWERNVGYGTTEHLAAIERLGPTSEHRQSFHPVSKYFNIKD